MPPYKRPRKTENSRGFKPPKPASRRRSDRSEGDGQGGDNFSRPRKFTKRPAGPGGFRKRTPSGEGEGDRPKRPARNSEGPRYERPSNDRRFNRGGDGEQKRYSRGGDDDRRTPFKRRSTGDSNTEKRYPRRADGEQKRYSRGGDEDRRTPFKRRSTGDSDAERRNPRRADGEQKRYGGARREGFSRRNSEEGSEGKSNFSRRPGKPGERRPGKRFNQGERPNSSTGKPKRYNSAPGRTGGRRKNDEFQENSSPKFGFFQKQQRPQSATPREDIEPTAQTGTIRLNRYISNSGVCSRREADELIKQGLITVNGISVTEMGYKVNPGDEVRHDGRLLTAERPVYVLLNKPKGYITTTDDPQERNTVMHLLGNSIKERIYPVGRLDRNTTGLLLLTNDGELTERLTHPSYEAKKIYKVELDKPLTKNDLEQIMQGVSLEEGIAQVDDLAIISPDKKTVGIEIHIGWNRVIRRIFEALGYQVEKLDRTVYAGLDKLDLPRGHWRFLSREEVTRLKHLR